MELSRGKKFAAAFVFIAIIAVIIYYATSTESGKSTFANIKSKFGSTGSVDFASLGVLMFISPTCPWCKKMIALLESKGQLKNITVVDMSTEQGKKMAEQYGADKQPVPSFISRATKVATVGYRESLSELFNTLNTPRPMPSSEEPSVEPVSGGGVVLGSVSSLQIVLFAREGCPWCTKAKEHVEQAGITPVIQIIDITTSQGQQMAAQLLPPGTSSVPAWVSLSTKKSVIGFKPIDQIIQELQ